MERQRRRMVLWVAVLLAGASTAEAQQAKPAAPALTDAEIAAIVVAANAIDAELGDLAASRATNPAIRQFGQSMASTHRSVNGQAAALVGRLGVKPVESAVSQQLRSDASAFRATLADKSGAAFDKAYIAHEVAYHQAVIDAVDKLLIPNAQNEELKQLLIDVRPALVGHLRHAEQLNAAAK